MAKEIVVNISTGTSAKNLNELNKSIETLKNQLEDAEFGSKQFKDLSGQLQNAQSEVKKLEKTFEGLEPEKKVEAFAKVGEGIAGGFAAATGAMALFGTESESIQKLTEKSQQAIAIAMGLRSIAEAQVNVGIAKRMVLEAASTVATYASAAALTIWNTVVGASTGALKIFRIALASTGIGALLVGIGLLIANFDSVSKWTKNIIDKFDFLKASVEFITVAFEKLTEAIGLSDTADEKALKTAQKRAEANKIQEAAMKNQIDLLKAKGASDEEIYHAEAALAKAAYKQALEIYNLKVKTGEATQEDYIALKDLETQYGVIVQTRIKAVQDANKKEAEDNAKKFKELKKQQADYLKDIKARLEDARIANIHDETERAIAQEQLELKRKLAAIKGASQAEQALRKELEITSADKIKALRDAKQKEINEDEAENRAKLIELQYNDEVAGQNAILLTEKENSTASFQAKRELALLQKQQQLEDDTLTSNQRIEIEAQYAKTITDINAQELENQKQLAELKKQSIINSATSAASGLSALSDAITANGAKQNAAAKALAVASIAINTAVSIGATIAGATAAAAAGGPAAPFLLIGYIASGIATVLSAFSSAKKLLGSAGSTTVPTGGATPSSSSGVQSPSYQSTDNNPRTRIETEPAPIRTYVLESEITDKQIKSQKIRDLSKL